MTKPGAIRISIDLLRPGVSCSYPIENDSGLLLIGAGTRITEQLISSLRERGIDELEVHENDLSALTGKSHKRSVAASEPKKDIRFTGTWEPNIPFSDMLVDRGGQPLDPKRTNSLKQGLSSAKSRFDQIGKMLSDRDLHSIDSVSVISDAFARSMLDDYDQTVGVIGTPTSDQDITNRSVRMSVIAMAVGVELGLDGPSVLELGLTGLLHDIGLMLLDPAFRDPSIQMNEAMRWEYEKHPITTAESIAHISEIPHTVSLAVQQVHEQYDGSGYPRGFRGQRIHQYARILNVVDAYLQLISPSSNRCGILPHDALGLMLHHAGRGIFDPTVIRAFLRTESLFPLGSNVELRNGARATVVRRIADNYATPVLACDERGLLNSNEVENQIIRPVSLESIEQMRIPVSDMGSIQWDLPTGLLMV